ncbi:four-carbon acid sugar kinase family protein [Bordetella genomosp. 1]|uniref:Four-carbon acid sugar kinase family protein n=1 Tax=Bordetella genomosp. 1 TaxID=1395607 RepID=A0ABX4EW25_9BORD|nr:four-carbon acid sugar kinase family protein [Bordetella genomosp. 1]OZI58638.1 hypothetical protein CAL27_18300 [Bordetella genomosp. 1]
MSVAPRLAWYGDDFTGATDTLAEVARAGWRSLLFLAVPTPARLAAAGPLDAIGIAGAARGMAPERMAKELHAAGHFLAGTGARILHYKCCSTFDSAPHVGSIGQAVQVLRQYAPHPLVPIVGGQPSIGRYCSFAQLFARAGAAPEIHRIDRHPVMSRHPVTPMHEADLRRHLAAQGLDGVQSLPHVAYPAQDDAAALDAWIAPLLRDTRGPLLLDVTEERHLAPLGRLMWRAAAQAPLLAVGASSVQQALARAVAADAALIDDAPRPLAQQARLAPARAPVLLLAGSLSPVTARQIDAARNYQRLAVDTVRLDGEPGYARNRARDAVAALAGGHHLLVHTLPPAEPPTAAQTAAAAEATGRLLAAIVRDCAAAGHRLTRIGVAGGDTSSQAVLALGLWGLSFHSVLAPGVAVSIGHSDDPATHGIELMLKGGQMGGEELFDQLVDGDRPVSV